MTPHPRPQQFRSNFGPIQEGDCAIFSAVSDTRCSTYLILTAFLTAECSTVELPGNCATSLFSFGFILLHRANSCHDLSVEKQVLSSRGLCAHALQPIVLSRAYGCYVPTPSLRWAVHYGPTRRFR